MKKLVLTIFIIALSTITFAQNTVEINCRMGVVAAEGGFDVGSDLLVIRGSFQDELGDPGGDWQGG